MAIFKVTAVPDFSQLKGEIAKLQSSPVTLGVNTQNADVQINATRQSLQKLTETFSPEGELRRSVADLPNVEAELFRGLLADYAREKDARIIVKGLRNATDFDQEYQMAAINRGIWADLETVFLPASIAYQHFSSTMVREMIRYGQPLEKYVPLPVAEELKHHLSN